MPFGRLEVDLSDPADATRPDELPQAIVDLTEAASQLVANLLCTQQALRAREAELATAVPVVARPEEAALLADRLEAVLRSGARAVGCDAAALYLLDDATTMLKIRAAWGLPPERLGQPARLLSGALADLEAMLGHAVVLEDQRLAPYWNPPEDFAAAVCLPVASASQILGTLWVFSRTQRPFSDAQVDVLETVAGRLAADLERRTLLREVAAARRGQTAWTAVRQFFQQRQPPGPFDTERWDVAWQIDWPEQQAGALCQCVLRPDDTVVLLAGAEKQDGIAGAVALHGLRMAACSHAKTAADPADLLNKTNRAIWETSPGDEMASLFCAFLHPQEDRLSWAAAGNVEVARLDLLEGGRPRGKSEIVAAAPPIGLDEQLSAPVHESSLDPAAAFLVRVGPPDWPQPSRSHATSHRRPEPVEWCRPKSALCGSAATLLAAMVGKSQQPNSGSSAPGASLVIRTSGPRAVDSPKSV